MERVPGGGLHPWSPVLRADALSLALCLLLLVCPRCALAMSPCKEEEYPVGAECCPKCKPGYRVDKPCGKDTGTSCVPCSRGSYTAHLNGLSECLQCRVCDPAMGLVTRRKCFSTENTVCGCDQGHFCVMEEGDDCAECRPHQVCGPGQRVRERGTERQDTRCADCPPGTFSPDGTLAECQPWTKCSGLFQTETKPGTRSTDATCSSSWPFYLPGVFGVILVALVPWIIMKNRRSRGLCAPKRARLQVTGDPAASQVLPDVTTTAVEETTSMVPERDRPADKRHWDSDVCAVSAVPAESGQAPEDRMWVSGGPLGPSLGSSASAQRSRRPAPPSGSFGDPTRTLSDSWGALRPPFGPVLSQLCEYAAMTPSGLSPACYSFL